MGGGVYDSSKINDILVRETGLGNPESVKEKKREIAAVDSIKKAGVNVDQVPDHVTNALTRDYSALMKKLNTKKFYLSGTMIEQNSGHIQFDAGSNFNNFDRFL